MGLSGGRVELHWLTSNFSPYVANNSVQTSMIRRRINLQKIT